MDSRDLADIAPAVASSRLRTLVVLDIDDTLLTSRQFFGSDRWYEWQKSLPEGDPGKVRCRFDVIALNYEAGRQQTTQPDAAALIKSLTSDKIIVTSRSPGARGGTVRELLWAGYELPRPLARSVDGQIYRWQKDAASKPVQVSYADGILMVAGQDKGVLLLDLWRRLRVHYDRVVLVDDGTRNQENMQAAMKAAGVAFEGLHYLRVAKLPPTADEIREGVEGWQMWRRFLDSVFPARLEDLDAERCFN